MNWPTDCTAVIPCLNEMATVGSLVRAVRRHLPAVVVIDDGSTDGTAAAAEGAGADVIRHTHSQGKGAALQAGWNRARERGFQWAMTMDGDGQHSSDDIPAFFRCAGRTPAALVVGNRMNDLAQMPWVRRLVNGWMSRRISDLARRHLPDSQCGFRLMNLPAWKALSISTTHFEIESEVLLAFARARMRIEFIPIQVIYKTERSKINPVRDTIRWLRWWQAAKRRESESQPFQTDTLTCTAVDSAFQK